MKKNIFIIAAFVIAALLYVPIACVLYNIVGLNLGDNEYVDIAISLIGFILVLSQNSYFSLAYNFLIDKNYKKHVNIAKQAYQSKSEKELSDLIWENSRGFDIAPPFGAPCYDRNRESKDSIVYYCKLEQKRRSFVIASKWMILYAIIAAFSLGFVIG